VDSSSWLLSVFIKVRVQAKVRLRTFSIVVERFQVARFIGVLLKHGESHQNCFDGQLSSFNSLIYIYAKCSKSGFQVGQGFAVAF